LGNSTNTPKLWTFEFLSLCLVVMTAFGNVSVFYGFYHYLGTIDIPVIWRGFLVGLEPMAAFILRLAVLPWLHVRNSYSVLTASLVLLILCSCSYLWVVTVPAMIVLRIVHGATFMLLTSAAIALIVNFIPKERSGQGFGILGVATMIPFAVIPPLCEALLPHVRGEADLYAGVSVFSVAAIGLLVLLRRHLTEAIRSMDGALLRRPSMSEIRQNFRIPAVLLLLSATFLVYMAHATFFYFLKDLSLELRAGDVGLFFTIFTITMIALRVLGGTLFDRLDKRHLLTAGLILLALSLLALPRAATPSVYYGLAGLYGLSVGIALPLLSALLFTASPLQFQGLNTNMTLFTLDLAYCLMPYLGGMLVAFGAGFGVLFHVSLGFVALALVMIALLPDTMILPTHSG
jgi:MFS family permease